LLSGARFELISDELAMPHLLRDVDDCGSCAGGWSASGPCDRWRLTFAFASTERNFRESVQTRPELLKSKIIVAEQVLSLRLRQMTSTTDNYEEQIALAAALKSLKFLKER
jgi:hypothetical protein